MEESIRLNMFVPKYMIILVRHESPLQADIENFAIEKLNTFFDMEHREILLELARNHFSVVSYKNLKSFHVMFL